MIGKIEKEKYDDDHEDVGAEAIADHVYKDRFEAFRYGHDSGLNEIISLIKEGE